MKGRGGAMLFLLVLFVGGWFYFGGSASGPDNLPDPKAPSADEAASGIQRFFDGIGSTISGWGELTWRMLSVALVVGMGIWIFKRVPLAVWLVIAAATAVVALLV